ncbi:hypothetical protein GR316_02200 [Falsirhodobacter algicola]|uniref:Arginine transporter n=2 Tax=Falsirhodobacter algicola TaxID=2692330 RepID=A0A8J8MV64_9RHOB|nr:hypothetical protein [Falsirhodobacter algicola]QUS36843.1 hypothetical protein GR316_02200 [Falsirhodobacter algicola]
MKKTLFALAAATLMPAFAQAGPVEKACLRSDRGAGKSSLCACIQGAADATLTGRDQRRAANFFEDPDAAQQMRVSKGASDSAFWRRYQAFGQTAEAYCG